MIILFTNDLSVGALLARSQEGLMYEFREGFDSSALEGFKVHLAGHLPMLESEVFEEDGTSRIALIPVTALDPRYEEAVAYELKARGFSARVIDDALRDLYLFMSGPRFSFEQRNHMISVVQHLPLEQALQTYGTLKEVMEAGAQLGYTS